MRTTVSIDDHLLALAKQRAVAEHRTLGDIVDDSLRTLFARSPAEGRARVALPVDGDPDGRLLVDIYDREALAEVLGDNERVHHARPRADS